MTLPVGFTTASPLFPKPTGTEPTQYTRLPGLTALGNSSSRANGTERRTCCRSGRVVVHPAPRDIRTSMPR